MKHYYPAYYESFHCIAADCPDSCCQGWDVVIDSDTESFYRTVKGDFGDRLRRAIVTDSDGDRVFRLADNKKCPFWGEDKLCDIYKELGEAHLCATCAQFPRLRMEYEDFTEHSLALACPEAARLILNTDNAYSSFTHTDAEGCADYDANVMRLLLESRLRCAELLTADKPLADRLCECLIDAEAVQARLYPSEKSPDTPYRQDALAELFDQLEYIDDRNREKIVRASHSADFSAQETELTRLALYDLYRYRLNSVGTLDVLSSTKFMIASVIVISNLSRDNHLALCEAAQLYSKEIEQSYENMERIFDALAYDPLLSSDHLIRFIQ